MRINSLALLNDTPKTEFLEEVGDPATGEPIGDTESNLISAIAGETHEYTSMVSTFC